MVQNQGRSQPHNPAWAGFPLSSFFLEGPCYAIVQNAIFSSLHGRLLGSELGLHEVMAELLLCRSYTTLYSTLKKESEQVGTNIQEFGNKFSENS